MEEASNHHGAAQGPPTDELGRERPLVGQVGWWVQLPGQGLAAARPWAECRVMWASSDGRVADLETLKAWGGKFAFRSNYARGALRRAPPAGAELLGAKTSKSTAKRPRSSVGASGPLFDEDEDDHGH